MKVLVCGGRDYTERQALNDFLDGFHRAYRIEVLIEGGAQGADRMAKQWAIDHGVMVNTYPADWVKHGRSAGPIRNQQMLDIGKPDLVIAFPGGRGTADMVRRAKAELLEVIEVPKEWFTERRFPSKVTG